MKRIVILLVLIAACLQSVSQFKASSDGHYITRNGKPFFWLGDTAWELFHKLTLEEADYYLKRRAAQGFTVIQAVVLAELDGLNTPNAYGQKPLLNNNLSTPNEAYFRHVDSIIRLAERYGLVIALLPTWGDKLWKAGWGTGPEIFTDANAETWGRWLGNRYRARGNVIWILGGDRNPRNESDERVWAAMAKGIAAGVGDADKAFISFHPMGGSGSYTWFHNSDWLDFNAFQNGHCRNIAIYDRITTAYNLRPAKPVLDAEPIYEDHPVCFNVADLGTSSAYDVRNFAYLDLFAGAFGHTYGCHDIWQFYVEGKAGVNGPHLNWKEAIGLPGAGQMGVLKKLMTSRPLLDRVPDQSIIVEKDRTPAERIQATRGKDYLMVYTAAGHPFTLNLGKISGESLKGFWFDPKNGKTSAVPPIDNKGQVRMKPPSTGYGNDWVLVLDDATTAYAKEF